MTIKKQKKTGRQNIEIQNNKNITTTKTIDTKNENNKTAIQTTKLSEGWRGEEGGTHRWLSMYLCIYVPMYLTMYISMYICLCIYVYIYVSISLSINLFVYCLFIYLFTYLFIYSLKPYCHLHHTTPKMIS